MRVQASVDEVIRRLFYLVVMLDFLAEGFGVLNVFEVLGAAASLLVCLGAQYTKTIVVLLLHELFELLLLVVYVLVGHLRPLRFLFFCQLFPNFARFLFDQLHIECAVLVLVITRSWRSPWPVNVWFYVTQLAPSSFDTQSIESADYPDQWKLFRGAPEDR